MSYLALLLSILSLIISQRIQWDFLLSILSMALVYNTGVKSPTTQISLAYIRFSEYIHVPHISFSHFLVQLSRGRHCNAVMTDLAVDGAGSVRPTNWRLATSTFLISHRRLVSTCSNGRHLSQPCVWHFSWDLPVTLALIRMKALKMGERTYGNRCWDYSQPDEAWGGGSIWYESN